MPAAIGGYGGIGVIVEVTMQLVDNVKVERQTELVQVDAYNDFFNKTSENDQNAIFQNGDLYPQILMFSIVPPIEQPTKRLPKLCV